MLGKRFRQRELQRRGQHLLRAGDRVRDELETGVSHSQPEACRQVRGVHEHRLVQLAGRGCPTGDVGKRAEEEGQSGAGLGKRRS